MWLTINPFDLSVRVHPTKQIATRDAIKRNRKDSEHPSFRLWEITDGYIAVYRGQLWRRMGEDFSADPWTMREDI